MAPEAQREAHQHDEQRAFGCKRAAGGGRLLVGMTNSGPLGAEGGKRRLVGTMNSGPGGVGLQGGRKRMLSSTMNRGPGDADVDGYIHVGVGGYSVGWRRRALEGVT
eukprot:261147-Chlamydomonas_euryale.AAC.1